MTEIGGLDREVTPQGKPAGLSPWYGVYEVVWGRMLTLVMGQKEGVQCIR